MTTRLPAAPLTMDPAFSERPWGGSALKTRFGKNVPEGSRIGESWELSDHPAGRSRVDGGPFAGEEFGAVVRRFPAESVGAACAPERYPLLVKIIDAQEDLSIQVHPDDAGAAARGDRGKTECWYVMDCAPGAEVVFGLVPGIAADDLRRGAADGSIESMVARHPLRPHTFLFVRAGTVHAILGGTTICEVQQSSDTTYRLWDWNRQPARPLHVEESIQAIDWKAAPPRPLHLPEGSAIGEPATLADNEFFRVRVLDVAGSRAWRLAPDHLGTGAIVVGISGQVEVRSPEGACVLAPGRTAFVPAVAADGTMFSAVGKAAARLLIAESRELKRA